MGAGMIPILVVCIISVIMIIVVCISNSKKVDKEYVQMQAKLLEYSHEEYKPKSGIEYILSKFIRRKTYVYSYTYNGKEYEVTSFCGLYSKERKAGDYVTIRVKKDDPSVIYEDLTWKDIKKI